VVGGGGRGLFPVQKMVLDGGGDRTLGWKGESADLVLAKGGRKQKRLGQEARTEETKTLVRRGGLGGGLGDGKGIYDFF